MALSIDRDFVRVDDKSYAINKINSVEVRKKDIQGSRGYILWWGLAVITLVGSLTSGNPSFWAIAFIALVGFLGYRSFEKRADRVLYRLFLVTSSGEAAAVETYDKDEIENVRVQIERAMAGR